MKYAVGIYSYMPNDKNKRETYYVGIIIFGPTGHTLKCAEFMAGTIKKYGGIPRIFDITRNLYPNGKMEKEIGDIAGEIAHSEYRHIVIGCPVYGGHPPYRFTVFLKKLFGRISEKFRDGGNNPKKRLPGISIFITYGGVSSGITLYRLAKIIGKRGYSVITAMKIAAEHSYTIKKEWTINRDRPGKEIMVYIEKMAAVIHSASTDPLYREKIDLSELKYLSAFRRFIDRVFMAPSITARFMPKPKINLLRCKNCGLCTKICPTGRISEKEGKIILAKKVLCYSCAACYNVCPTDAIEFRLGLLEPLLKMAGRKKGPIYTAEEENVLFLSSGMVTDKV